VQTQEHLATRSGLKAAQLRGYVEAHLAVKPLIKLDGKRRVRDATWQADSRCSA
jgi:hypothetical protein